MSSVLERIKQIADNERIAITSFEGKIGASKGVLSRALANKTDIQSKWLSKIVDNFPRYSVQWLLTGEGDMLKDYIAVASDRDTNSYMTSKEEKVINATIDALNLVISTQEITIKSQEKTISALESRIKQLEKENTNIKS